MNVYSVLCVVIVIVRPIQRRLLLFVFFIVAVRFPPHGAR